MSKGGQETLVRCSLCDEVRGGTPRGQWWEVKVLGPDRRVHEACFRAVMDDLREMPDGEMLRMVEEHERERAGSTEGVTLT